MSLKKRIEKRSRKRSPKLTARERSILSEMEKGKPYAEAAEIVGVPKGHRARQEKTLARKLVFSPWPEVLRRGIRDEAVQKALTEALEATKPVGVKVEGQKKKEVLVIPDFDIRLKAVELVLKYSQEHQSSVPVTINVVAMGAAKTNILVVPQGQTQQIAGSVLDSEESNEP